MLITSHNLDRQALAQAIAAAASTHGGDLPEPMIGVIYGATCTLDGLAFDDTDTIGLPADADYVLDWIEEYLEINTAVGEVPFVRIVTLREAYAHQPSY
jgi:hypothetical protein